MGQSYFQQGMFAPATFSLFIRNYPSDRSYFVSAGLEDVLRFLKEFEFTKEDVEYLSSTEIFAPDFLNYLSGLRFTGDVWAIPEGRLFFLNEPILEVTAPIIQAQLVETFITNQVNLQSIIATKASRCIWAAKGRPVMDFALRRAHGMDAGLKVARATYMTGFASTSNVLAGKAYGIPVDGTMAHSFISSFEDELEAFRAFASSFPERCILLIDTYDTIQGARKAALVGKEMRAAGHCLQGVRLDSGNIEQLSQEVRRILDESGLQNTLIIASGALDEHELDNLLSHGAKIDSFGVGTKVGVSADAPWSDISYKLVQYGDRSVFKLSTGKAYLPGEKQVRRYADSRGNLSHDVIGLRNEKSNGGEPLLRQVMKEGELLSQQPSLENIRCTFSDEISLLDEKYKALNDPPTFPVETSTRLKKLRIKSEQVVSTKSLSLTTDKMWQSSQA